MHLTYVALHELTWCMVVWCTQNAPRRQQFHVAPAMPALYVHHFRGYRETRHKNKKQNKKTSHSYRITCERNESARERRKALYKSDQQQQQQQRDTVVTILTAGQVTVTEHEAGATLAQSRGSVAKGVGVVTGALSGTFRSDFSGVGFWGQIRRMKPVSLVERPQQGQNT